MKIQTIGLFLLSILSAMANAATISGKAPYDFTGSTICSAIVTSNCLDHLEFGILVGTAFNTLESIPIPAGAAGAVIITVPAVTFNIAFGSTQFSLVMVAKDGAGNRITSDPAKSMAVFVVTPNAPGPPSLISN